MTNDFYSIYFKEHKCDKCGKIKLETEFYSFKDNTKDSICKECRLEGCLDSRPSDYFPLMELYDIPFIYEEWENMVNKHIKLSVIKNKPYKTIFGRYLSLMKLCGYKQLGWLDSPMFATETKHDENLNEGDAATEVCE